MRGGHRAGRVRPVDMRAEVPKAAAILQNNVYGWFERIERGIYGLSEAGRLALERWPQPDDATP